MKIIDLRNDNRVMGGNSLRNVSQISNIARHHSATTSGSWQAFQNHWRSLGWNTGGYHIIIDRDGTIYRMYRDNVITNGIGNHNTNTFHICLIGNGSFTAAQETAFDQEARSAMQRFGLRVADVLGHNEFSGARTACPGINMTTVRNRLQAPTVAGNTHVVRAGENLTTIARQHNTTVAELVRINSIANPNAIRVGQVIHLPTGVANNFFPIPANRNLGLVDSLNLINVNSSFDNRRRIAIANGINNYTGTASQNNQLLTMLRLGKLRRP